MPRSDGLMSTRCGLCLVLAAALQGPAAAAEDGGEPDRSRFSNEPRPLQIETFPDRPAPLLELGDDFLGTGNIRDAWRLPTGAVWHPSFWVYGDFRTAIQTFDDGVTRTTEWANNLNLYGNLQLAATERILIGLRPLEQDGRFTSYLFEPDTVDGWQEDLGWRSLEPRTLFFEGELGELFPKLDKGDRYPLDLGISVGRQPLLLQDGLLVNDDAIDLFALTKNSILPKGGSSLRVSGLFGWNEIERANNVEDHDAFLVGLDAAADFPKSTFQADVLYVLGDNDSDGLFFGLGQTRRINKVNLTVRAVQSLAVDRESPAVGTGTLFFTELSYTPSWGHDIAYVNGFWAIDQFSSAIRGPLSGGPLGRTGLMFDAVGLGNYGSPLRNQAMDAAGGVIGYQMFFGELRRQQVTLEFGGRAPTDGNSQKALALGARYQQALGQRVVFIVDAFGSLQNEAPDGYGGRFEFLVKF